LCFLFINSQREKEPIDLVHALSPSGKGKSVMEQVNGSDRFLFLTAQYLLPLSLVTVPRFCFRE
jgi:hypothetical protein